MPQAGSPARKLSAPETRSKKQRFIVPSGDQAAQLIFTPGPGSESIQNDSLAKIIKKPATKLRLAGLHPVLWSPSSQGPLE
jgi:hypothetical protein